MRRNSISHQSSGLSRPGSVVTAGREDSHLTRYGTCGFRGVGQLYLEGLQNQIRRPGRRLSGAGVPRSRTVTRVNVTQDSCRRSVSVAQAQLDRSLHAWTPRIEGGESLPGPRGRAGIASDALLQALDERVCRLDQIARLGFVDGRVIE